MRVALIGAAGQLGTDLQTALADEELIPLGHGDIELTSDESIANCLGQLEPQLVINCAAYNLVDRAEDEPQVAHDVNALGPRRLAIWCAQRDVCLTHFSSDYVFGLDADRNKPYSETDAPGPQSAYAASKLQGEYFVRAICPRHFVIRTCGLYGVAGARGAGKGNFIEAMLRLGAERDELGVVNDQCCTPTSTADLAVATAELIRTDAFGLYHATNAGQMSWFELACEVFRQAQISVQVNPITSAQFGAKATRPAYSVLNCQRLHRVIGHALPEWPDAVARYLRSRQD
jgi:dTDP-4-dehydrorhamnose reductase